MDIKVILTYKRLEPSLAIVEAFTDKPHLSQWPKEWL